MRLNWSGIYYFGYRIYLLDKEKEVNKGRKIYKINLYIYLEYLVDYIPGILIYRIWISKLKRIIITRNIIFDKSRLYFKNIKQYITASKEYLIEIANNLDINIIENLNSSIIENNNTIEFSYITKRIIL